MGWKFLGIFVGLIADIAVSLILGLVFGAMLAFFLTSQGVALRDLGPRVAALLQQPGVILAEMGLGSFGSLVGGFVTGWIAGSSRAVCGAVMGCASSAAAIPFWSGQPLWANVLGTVLTLVLATAGAFLADAVLGRKITAALPR